MAGKVYMTRTWEGKQIEEQRLDDMKADLERRTRMVDDTAVEPQRGLCFRIQVWTAKMLFRL